MKTALLLAASAVTTVSARRELLDEIQAAACALSAPCSSANCLAVAGLVAEGQYCRVIFTDPMSVVGPTASDGNSLGVLALMIDADTSEALDTAVCNAWKEDQFANDCVPKTPLAAMIETMETNYDTTCNTFTTEILDLVNAPPANSTGNSTGNETEPEFVLAQASAAAKNITNILTPQIWGAVFGAESAANLSSAMATLELDPYNFVGPALGYLPEIVDIETHIMTKAGACVAEALGPYYGDNEITGIFMGLLQDVIPDENTTEAALGDALGAEIFAAYAANITAGGASAGQVNIAGAALSVNETALNTMVVEYALGVAGNHTAEALNQYSSDIFDQLIANNGATYVEPAVLEAELAFGAARDTVCGAAANQTACEEDWAAGGAVWIMTYLGELASTKTILDNMQPYFEAAVASSELYASLIGFEAHMSECAPVSKMESFLDLFKRAADNNSTAGDMAFLQAAVVTLGCAVDEVAPGTGNPETVNRQMCFVGPISQKAPQVFAAMTSEPSKTFTPELIFGMKDSASQFVTRCAAVNVTVVATPTPKPTQAPVVPTASTISGASPLHVPLLAAVAIFMAALL